MHRVAVVGCGIGGAAAAQLLAERGLDVTVFERAAESRPVGSGLLLQPSGQRALATMGLIDGVRAQSAEIGEVLALSPRGRELVRLRYDELGADGSRSALRRIASPGAREHAYHWGALWGTAECEPVGGRLHQALRGTRLLVGLLPVGSGRVNFFWSVRHGELDPLRERGFPRFREDVLRLCPLAEEPLAQLDSFESLSVATYRHVWKPAWHRGRIVLVGDAAHAMSPHLGQGVNLALADAIALSDAFAVADAPEEAFRLYAARRRDQTRYYSTVTCLLTPFFQSNGRVKGWLRDAGMPVLARNRWARRTMTVAMAGLARSRPSSVAATDMAGAAHHGRP